MKWSTYPHEKEREHYSSCEIRTGYTVEDCSADQLAKPTFEPWLLETVDGHGEPRGSRAASVASGQEGSQAPTLRNARANHQGGIRHCR